MVEVLERFASKPVATIPDSMVYGIIEGSLPALATVGFTHFPSHPRWPSPTEVRGRGGG